MGQFSSSAADRRRRRCFTAPSRLGASFSNCTAYENEILDAGRAATSPIPWRSSTPPRPSTARCPSRTYSASPPSSAGSTTAGKSFTATPTRGPQSPRPNSWNSCPPLIVRRHQARAGQQCRLARGPHAYHPVLRATAGPCR